MTPENYVTIVIGLSVVVYLLIGVLALAEYRDSEEDRNVNKRLAVLFLWPVFVLVRVLRALKGLIFD